MSPEPAAKRPRRLPLLAVRDLVVFPHMVLPLSVGRAKSVKALEAAMRGEPKLLAVVAQKDVRVEDPQPQDLFSIGVLSNFRRLWEDGLGKLVAVYALSLFGFVIWVGLAISWLLFSGVKPPLAS